MRPFSAICFLFTLVSAPAVAQKVVSPQPASVLPPVVLKQIPGAWRFSDTSYNDLIRGNGLEAASPRVIFARLATASASNENYKALFLARLFTSMQPQNAVGWQDRAKLALSLSLKEEANVSLARASDPSSTTSVPCTLLPGTAIAVKPASLADWAAAIALMSADTSTVRGSNFEIAIRDDISGVTVASADEVRQNDSTLVGAGLPAEGPWADPRALNVNQILTNSFVLQNPDAMAYHSVDHKKMFAGMLMAGLAGVSQASNPAAAAADTQMSGQMVTEASDIKSNYSSGHYSKVTYPDAKTATVSNDKPKSSGKAHAVGSPLPILWASGPIGSADFAGRLSTGTKPIVTEIKPGQEADPSKLKAKSESVPDLRYPRLGILCADTCSTPLALMELILTSEDIGVIAPSVQWKAPDTQALRSAYLQDKLTLSGGNFSPGTYLGYDDKGMAYRFTSSPAIWLVAAGK